MNSSAGHAKTRPRRKKHFVDRSLQGTILATLVTLEIALVAASSWLVHWHLNELIEENLYRVHLAASAPIFEQLLQEASGTFALFAGINLLALTLAEVAWSVHENAILQEFMCLVDKTRALDFSKDAASAQRHEVLSLTRAWRNGERARLAQLREQMQKLEVIAAANPAAQHLRDGIEAMQRILSRADAQR
jgi:hypothetical protein